MNNLNIVVAMLEDMVARDIYTKMSSGTKKRLDSKMRRFKKRGKVSEDYTLIDVIKKFITPICYVSGQEFFWNKCSLFSFDHVVPVSKSRNSNLNNLQIMEKKLDAIKDKHPIGSLLVIMKKIVEKEKKECYIIL